MTQPGRNDPCPCGSGSGKKYTHCCERKLQAPIAKANTAFIPGALQMALQQHQSGQLPQARLMCAGGHTGRRPCGVAPVRGPPVARGFDAVHRPHRRRVPAMRAACGAQPARAQPGTPVTAPAHD
ncbi:MAG: SEC-C domain-containing protein [Rhodoferax sp.]|nr:SEC-C domain-containing protein [Rhodoferax sp.]